MGRSTILPVFGMWSLAALLCLTSCTDKESTADTVEVEAVPVRVDSPVRDEVVERVRAESTLRAIAQVQVTAEQIGDVRALNVDIGDVVEKDQVLARLKNDDLDLQIAQAGQNLRAQERELKSAHPLFEDGYLSRQAFEELELMVEQTRTSLSRLRTTQRDQRIRAPIAGVILQRNIENGQQVAAGSPLFEIADVSELRLRIPIPERAIRQVRVGQPAHVTLRALDDEAVPAQVIKLFPSVDSSTGTILVELSLKKTTLDDGTELRPGMYGRGEIEIERRPDVLLVPRKALVEEGAESFLFVLLEADVVDEKSSTDASKESAEPSGSSSVFRVTQRAVTTGWRGDGRVEITGNLNADERFVVLGQNRLREGSTVRVVESIE